MKKERMGREVLNGVKGLTGHSTHTLVKFMERREGEGGGVDIGVLGCVCVGGGWIRELVCFSRGSG
jgi:hypothetical protein